MKLVSLISAAAAGFLLAGCSSVTNSHLQKEPMISDYLTGKDAQVEPLLAAKLNSTAGSGDELMWRLEAGAFRFDTGDYPKSIAEFEKAEALVTAYDDRATVSVRDAGAEGGAALTNLNVLPYRGFCRDRIMLSMLKSLAYLGEGREDSFNAQLRRLRTTQKEIRAKYDAAFEAEKKELSATARKNPAATAGLKTGDAAVANTGSDEFNRALAETRKTANKGYADFLNPAALFLSGLGSLREGDTDNCLIDFKRVYEAMPQNPLAQRLYVTVLGMAKREIPAELREVKPFDFPLDRDCVYVIFANGRGAAFRQVAIYFPVMTAYPVCEFYPAPYRFLKVEAGQSCETGLLADMDAILAREYNERLPGMITRIVISTAIKEGASYTGAWAVGRENELAGIGVLLGSMVYRATFNTADTRSWEMLPREFQLGVLPMPKDRKVTVDPDGLAGRALTVTIPENARSAIIYVSAPSAGNVRAQVLGMSSR